MRRIAIGMAALLMLAGPAAAQRGKGQPAHEPTAEEIAKKQDKEAVDRQYRDTLKRTDLNTTAPVKVDPWANMRGDTSAKR